MTTPVLEVVETGPFTTVQDLGRHGHARLGVGTSGAVDRVSHDRANRLVGNRRSAATLEVTFGGLVLRALTPTWVAATGAPCVVSVDEVPQGFNSRVLLRPGQVLRLGVPTSGLRTYLAVRGGVGVPEVLGSRATDTLAGLGPDPLVAGQLLPVGVEAGTFPSTDHVPVGLPVDGPVRVDIVLGPRDDWFTREAVQILRTGPWRVSAATNRIGVRLDGPLLQRAVERELPSEGVPVGAVQVPPSGPIVFLDDHPVTGGYPVIGVVSRPGVDRIAQARPGQPIVFDVVPALERTATRAQPRTAAS